MTARQKKLLFRILAALVLFAVLFALGRMQILPEKYSRYLLYLFLTCDKQPKMPEKHICPDKKERRYHKSDK